MPNPSTALLISGDVSLIESCQGVVNSFPGLRLRVLGEIHEADSSLLTEEINLVLVHLVQQDDAKDVVRLLRQTACLGRSVALLVITEEHDAELAWSLVRLGAADFLTRPLDLDRLASLVNTFAVGACPANAGAAPGPKRRVDLGNAPAPPNGRGSAAMDRLMEQVRVVAPQDTTILLSGETGTGKTHLARLIHELSPRRAEPLLVVNCGALAAELIESEMFGHVKGAFTGADRDRTGKFAAVGRGTLLLDEIDALPPALQAKLLRAVEERVFEPVGSNKSVPVQARLIAASNSALEQEVETGRFRCDLYYRLNVIGFYLPPLRERPAMIPYLVASFITEFALRGGRPVHGIAGAALRVLETYTWPGNIRELRNVIERAVALCPGSYIRCEDLPEAICSAAAAGLSRLGQPEHANDSRRVLPLHQARKKAEVARIVEALQKHGNNRLRTARELGISRRTLYKKLHRYGLMGTKTAPAKNGVATSFPRRSKAGIRLEA